MFTDVVLVASALDCFEKFIIGDCRASMRIQDAQDSLGGQWQVEGPVFPGRSGLLQWVNAQFIPGFSAGLVLRVVPRFAQDVEQGFDEVVFLDGLL